MFIDSRTLLFLDSGTLLPVDSRTLLLIDSCTLLVIFGTTSLSSTISRLGRSSSNHWSGRGRGIVSSNCGSSSNHWRGCGSGSGRIVSARGSSRSWSTVSRLPLFTSSLEEIEGENGAGHSLHEKARSQNNLKYQNWSIYIRPQNHSNSTL